MQAVALSSPTPRAPASAPAVPATRNRDLARRFYPLLLVLAGLGAYANSFKVPLVLDDLRVIGENRLLRQPLASWRELLASPRAVWLATLAANHAVGGVSVEGYHAVNLAIHLLAALTLYGLVRRTLLLPCRAGRWAPVAPELALGVSLLWLVHPLQTESVTYLTQRAESLMGLFYLLTLYTLVHGATSPTPRRRLGWYVLAVLCCALGMRTKEVMLTAPLLALLYDRIFLAPSWRELWRRRGLLHLGLAATLLLLAGAVRGAFAPTAVASAPAPGVSTGAAAPHAVVRELPGAAGFHLRRITPLGYLLSQPAVLAHYLRLAFFPDSLCLDYGWPPAKTAADIVPAGLLIVTLLGITAWALLRRPALGFLGAWFFLILAPTSSILPIADLAAEHRMYLSLAAVLVLVVVGGYALLERLAPAAEGRRWLMPAALLAVVLVFLGLTWVRNEDYHSPLAIWSDVVAKRPDNPRGQCNLGLILLKEGRLKEALVCEVKALRLDPHWSGAHTNLGLAMLAQNQLAEKAALTAVRTRQEALHRLVQNRLADAIFHFREELKIDPDHKAALSNLGTALMMQHNTRAAIPVLTRAVQLDPANVKLSLLLASAQHEMGKALLQMGNSARALECLRASVSLAPKDITYRLDLADALADAGQEQAATEQFGEVFRLQPNLPQAFNKVAWSLATNPDPGRRDGKHALRLAEQVSRASGQRNPVFLDTLAAAQAETGDFEEAVKTARQALRLARARNDTELARSIEERLRLYEKRQAYRIVSAVRS